MKCDRYVLGQGWRLTLFPEVVVTAPDDEPHAAPVAQGAAEAGATGAIQLGNSAEYLSSLCDWLQVHDAVPDISCHAVGSTSISVDQSLAAGRACLTKSHHRLASGLLKSFPPSCLMVSTAPLCISIWRLVADRSW